MKKPNFFLIGAPKCGTTSLAYWLSLHKNIFFSSPKEVFYFCENPNNIIYNTIERYESIFQKANSNHIAVGEGSTTYLSSTKAVKSILIYQKSAKFIVCLRDPVQMAHSMFYMLKYHLIEDADDFEKAWRLQKQRSEGRNIPENCKFPNKLQYGYRCSLGLQMKNLFKIVCKNNVHVVLLDDMKVNPQLSYATILDFLKVPDDGRTFFPVLNSAKKVRFKYYKKLLRTIYYIKRRIIHRHIGFGKYLKKINQVPITKKPLSSDFREELNNYFKDDIQLLSRTINRDLSSWLS